MTQVGVDCPVAKSEKVVFTYIEADILESEANTIMEYSHIDHSFTSYHTSQSLSPLSGAVVITRM